MKDCYSKADEMSLEYFFKINDRVNLLTSIFFFVKNQRIKGENQKKIADL